jgi:tetratricopeptide (TPR) repeat protein
MKRLFRHCSKTMDSNKTRIHLISYNLDNGAGAVVIDGLLFYIEFPYTKPNRHHCLKADLDQLLDRHSFVEVMRPFEDVYPLVEFLMNQASERELLHGKEYGKELIKRYEGLSERDLRKLLDGLERKLIHLSDFEGTYWGLERLLALPRMQFTPALYAQAMEIWEKCQDLMIAQEEQEALGCFVSLMIVVMGISGNPMVLERLERPLRLLVDTEFIDVIDLLNYAELMQRNGKTQEAFWAYERIIAKDPEAAIGYNGRGILFHDGGDMESAIADYSQAIALDPEYAVAYCNRGISKDELGQWELATEDYSRCIALDPEYSSAFNNRAYCYLQLGRLPEALTDAEAALALEETSMYLATLAEIHSALGNVEPFYENLEKALAMNPEDWKFLDPATVARHAHEERFQALGRRYKTQ